MRSCDRARAPASVSCVRPLAASLQQDPRDYTERMLGAFGVQLAYEGRTIAMEGGQPLRGTAVRVPADFSSAAFFLVAGCLAADRPLTLINIA